ncbi:MAG: hypothetical protein N2258_03860 [Brevinematales bacterium]|nr:hypothetical protein [Brevinematales bacterium]
MYNETQKFYTEIQKFFSERYNQTSLDSIVFHSEILAKTWSEFISFLFKNIISEKKEELLNKVKEISLMEEELLNKIEILLNI